ncbi:sensor histidine kinase [Desulfovibrio sp. OttesenSCG-928-O18]|nr:sensor histidine kinase [Desulfovibrio sp. OttesenSCG-928-O18]
MLHSCDDADKEPSGEERRRMVLEERIREKISDYTYYKFTVRQTRALNIFFDLAQEYEDLCYLYHLPVQVLQFFFNIKAELYARDDAGVFMVQTPKVGPEAALPDTRDLAHGPRPSGPWWFFPVKGRPGNARETSGRNAKKNFGRAVTAPGDEREVLAILAILPEMALTEHEKLFYEKFANRLGFSLHNRILALKNLEHIEFVRTLVHDIGHNVIVPNLQFKLLMRQMAGKITALRQLSDTLMTEEENIASLHDLCDKIESHYDEISKHFHQSSFFLETLLRQSHFDQGKYVLQRTRFHLVSRVVAPQLERYRLRFQERNIAVEESYSEEALAALVDADVGLLSQVAANFFSNGVKYTRTTREAPEMLMRCSARIIPDRFGKGEDGIEVAMLTTGKAIAPDEADQLFGESFRASNTGDEQGTGHGLYFSRLIISQHGGECGYRREKDGNVFFLTLPVLREENRQEEAGDPSGSGRVSLPEI